MWHNCHHSPCRFLSCWTLQIRRVFASFRWWLSSSFMFSVAFRSQVFGYKRCCYCSLIEVSALRPHFWDSWSRTEDLQLDPMSGLMLQFSSNLVSYYDQACVNECVISIDLCHPVGLDWLRRNLSWSIRASSWNSSSLCIHWVANSSSQLFQMSWCHHGQFWWLWPHTHSVFDRLFRHQSDLTFSWRSFWLSFC